MEALSPMHLLILLLIIVNIIPIARIIHRTGHSRWLSLLAFIPLANWVFLWVFAFIQWPAVNKPRTQASALVS